MSVAKDITDFLDSKRVSYSIDHHAPCATAQDLAAEEGLSGYRVAKSVVCIADGEPVILVLPAALHVDLNAACKDLEADALRLADPDEIADFFPECELANPPPPLPLWDNASILVDSSLAGDEIVFAAGTPNDAIRMNSVDWLDVTQPFIGHFAAPWGQRVAVDRRLGEESSTHVFL